jgi:hypothetical protein
MVEGSAVTTGSLTSQPGQPTSIPVDIGDAIRARSLSAKGKARLLAAPAGDNIKLEPSDSPMSGPCDVSTLGMVCLPILLIIPMSNFVQDNQDHCSACRSVGSLLYCDSCPRAFHLWCLNPPMEHCDLPGEDASWHCPACRSQSHVFPSYHPLSLFAD